MKINSNNSWLSAISDKKNIMLAVKMSLVVGTLLNCINQAECLINQDFEQLNIPKLLFTYSVPFFVSIYSSTIAKFNR
ncbi:hypothetical protein BFP97_14330 [Roseivirga sp. 4D4]|uniref:nitrate/nitrite transporter NrtS n=1 Tax=Roseivirga sp. 4D4 TaxID=1889784 RepID=UPI000853B410|nr:nitrate/nitrite transporter NrtS [Roseivirga sp. 4D4]OEK02627.1 hypothetical protein BFP97_14330 [Roseivirga sp. 4D4]